ncbi:hypothetical protein J7L05_07005 [bacterium]|nr:hypothetical protein [bacterium]
MIFQRLFILLSITVMAALIIGCSGNTTDPVSNDTAALPDSMPIIGLSAANGVYDAVGIMGAYDLYFDAETLTAEITSTRKSSIGESFIVSGMGYWNVLPCGNCLTLDAIVPEGDHFKVTFKISHPFPLGNPGEPSSGKNRQDLDIFDLALAVQPRGLASDNYLLTGGGTYIYPEFCVNADAYTTELANLTGDPAALPYFLVVDDSDTGMPTYNEFPMGTTDSLFDVYFNTGGTFTLYLTMGYGASATWETRFACKYYNPEFNRKAAWKVDVTPPNGDDPPSMANTWNNQDTTTEFDVVVEVFDWQIGATVYPLPADFANAPENNIYAASEVAQVSLEIPGMFSTLKTMTTADSGFGAPAAPLVYSFAVANENGLSSGTYYGLVMVDDSRPPLTEADMRDFLVHCPEGVDRYNYIMPEYAAYQVFPAVVVGGCGPITGEITSPDCPISGVYDDAMIMFSAEASSDNGGDPIASYEWDMDYDGTTFDVDGTGASAMLGPFDNPTCGTPGEEPVDYTVAVRATDSCSPPNVTVFDTCVVTVDNCETNLISSIGFVAKPAADSWFDVCVMADSYVYVIADHDATGNTDGNCEDGMRTALQFDNDLSNMTVMNEADGMAAANPGSREWLGDWIRMDVSIGGNLITSQCGAGIGTWSVSGATATSEACCWALACPNGSSPVPDVADHNASGGYGSSIIGFGQTHEDCDHADWALGFNDSDLVDYNGYNSSGDFLYTHDGLLDYLVGIEGIDGTENILVFYSSGTEGALSIWGDCYDMGEDAAILDSAGSLGTGPGEFTGGLDVSIDSSGNIVTVEDHGTSFRFQKFTSDLTYVYTSVWQDTDSPMRIDFDKGDDTLYMLTDAGVHILSVN